MCTQHTHLPSDFVGRVRDFHFKMGTLWLSCLKLLPTILYTCYAYTLLLVGVWALAQDHSVKDHICGRTYHVWKFCCLNVVLWLLSCVSYCVWRGGGEGARARAMVLIVMYFGFFMWGLLMWVNVSSNCSSIFQKQFHMIYAFHHICTITNGVFFFLFLLHESFVGKQLGGDFTIMADVQHRYNTPIRPPMDMINSQGSNHTSSQWAVQPPQGPSVPVPPNGLPPQLSYEYEKIMQSTSSSTLPQTTP